MLKCLSLNYGFEQVDRSVLLVKLGHLIFKILFDRKCTSRIFGLLNLFVFVVVVMIFINLTWL